MKLLLNLRHEFVIFKGEIIAQMHKVGGYKIYLRPENSVKKAKRR